MNDDFEHELHAAQAWARKAEAQGWLGPDDAGDLRTLDNRSPASLFDDRNHRPLVVALFGGTGVGKSTLLNRLAGQAIARTGVERPTSREVSLYLHASLSIQHLPEGFPLERARSASHHDESLRQVVWIDMPDIDSVETVNRETVLAWLPHVDLLVYVVSPERYRDDQGWRLLQAQAQAHAWLFVMNQWDRGYPVQLEDFAQLLRQGGFEDPLLLHTDCREPAERRKADDFDKLAETVRTLAERHVIEQLASRALAYRRDQLADALNHAIARLGPAERVAALPAVWQEIWREVSANLLRGLEWPVQEVARRFVARTANPLEKAVNLDDPAPDSTDADNVLWDEWAAMELQDALDRLVLEADAHLPVTPLRVALTEIAPNAGKLLLTEARRGLRASLSHPGTAVQRFFLGLTGLCAWLLPLAAIGWVAWELVNAFHESEQTHSGYLGLDFAIHSGLLVAIAWLLPWFIHRQLKPSAEKTAVRGLRDGIDAGLAAIDQKVNAALACYRDDWHAVSAGARTLLPARDQGPARRRGAIAADATLQRLIPRPDDSREPAHSRLTD